MNVSTYRKLGNTQALSKAERNARRWFNKFICLRDLRRDNTGVYGICISSGKRWDAILYSDKSIMNGREWCASHYWNEDAYASVRFDERNVNGQFQYLNHHLSGDKTNYEVGLRKKIGDSEFEKLKIDKNKAKKFFIDDYEKVIEHYKKRARIEAERLGIRI